MAKMDRFREVLAKLAPGIGGALGGPVGAAAGTILAKTLGLDPAKAEEVEEAVINADPDTVLKIREAEHQFQEFMKKAEIEILALDNLDRAGARAREIAMRDWMPSILAVVITVGFLGVLAWILKWGIAESGRDVTMTLVGVLGTAFIGVYGYYFGSSAGSRRNSETVQAIAKSK
jgi:hypothetical protein